MARKPFAARPLKPGAAITWKQYLPSGGYVERSGQVWALAPSAGPGTKTPVWVIPEEPLPSDAYKAVVVAARSTSQSWAIMQSARGLAAGELFSLSAPLSYFVSMQEAAAAHAYRVRQEALTAAFTQLAA